MEDAVAGPEWRSVLPHRVMAMFMTMSFPLSRPRRWVALSALGALVFVGGCRPGYESVYGPLETGTSKDVRLICVAAGRSTDFTDGSNVIRYRGTVPLTITDVDLVDGEGLKLAEVLLVPVRIDLVGSWSEWPPPKAAKVLRGAVAAKGAEMSRDGANEYNLVAHLIRPDVNEPVVAGAVRLFYTVGHKEYGSVTTVRLGVKSRSGQCE